MSGSPPLPLLDFAPDLGYVREDGDATASIRSLSPSVELNELPIRIDRCHRVFDVSVCGEGDFSSPFPLDGFNQNMSGLNMRPYFDCICDLGKRWGLETFAAKESELSKEHLALLS